MKKLTIAEMRKKELARFSEVYSIDLADAKKLVNSFYRFCGLESNLFYLENNESTANSDYVKDLQKKEESWTERLQKNLPFMVWKWFGLAICLPFANPEQLRRHLKDIFTNRISPGFNSPACFWAYRPV